MHFRSTLLCASALFAAALAKIQITSGPSAVQGGKSYTFKWTGAVGDAPVTLELKQGASGNLKTVSTITQSATGGSFTWNVPDSLVTDNNYAIYIDQGNGNNNYWAVSIAASGVATTSASSASSSASASKSSSASSSASSSSSSGSSSATSSHSSTITSSPTRSASSSASSSSTTDSTTSQSSSASNSSSAPAPSGDSGAANVKSNAALLLGAAAAMAYLA